MRVPQDRIRDEPPAASPLTLSMLTSEGVYKLVVVVERTIRWFIRAVIRPGLLLVWCLRW